MAFQTPITISDALERIHKRQYALPAIQREFVWSQEQICALFDSLMRSARSCSGKSRRNRYASTEPPRVCRRPFCLSHAAMSDCSSMA